MFEYLKGGRCFGPISEQELLELADAGVIGPDDAVREAGELGYRPARLVVGLLRAAWQVAESAAPPRLSSRPSVGGYTVFASMPPIPPNPVPRLERLHCPHCGSALASDAVICGNCAAVVELPPCPRCRAANPTDARFCGGCGSALG